MSSIKESEQPVPVSTGGPQNAQSIDERVLAAARAAISSPSFQASRPFILRLYVPYAAADPYSDMGEQTAGDRYWIQGRAWSWSWNEATRYTAEGARIAQSEMSNGVRNDVKVVNANAMLARIEAVAAVRKEMQATATRTDLLAAIQKVRDLPVEAFENAILTASVGGLADPSAIVIKHGRTDNTVLGPYFVVLMRGDRVSASMTGIKTADACQERAEEYARLYGAPIVTPILPQTDVDASSRDTPIAPRVRM
jgi:hypothetical protein